MDILPPPRQNNLGWILAVIFAVGTILGGSLAVWAISSSRHDRAVLQSAQRSALAAGKAAQLKTDQMTALTLAESPYRSYTAPILDGGFVINFPKNWSAYVEEGTSGLVQVNLILNPEVVKLVGGGDNTYATTVQLLNRQSSAVLAGYQDRIKTGKLRQSSVTVAGIAASALTGQYDEKHSGQLVLVPVRDKTLVFTLSNHAYDNEFALILAQAKIKP